MPSPIATWLANAPDLNRWLWAVGVGTARTLPIAYMIPAFGGKNVPAQVRMGLGLALAIVCLPQVLLALPSSGGLIFWVLLLGRESLVGFTVGFLGCLPLPGGGIRRQADRHPARARAWPR